MRGLSLLNLTSPSFLFNFFHALDPLVFLKVLETVFSAPFCRTTCENLFLSPLIFLDSHDSWIATVNNFPVTSPYQVQLWILETQPKRDYLEYFQPRICLLNHQDRSVTWAYTVFFFFYFFLFFLSSSWRFFILLVVLSWLISLLRNSYAKVRASLLDCRSQQTWLLNSKIKANNNLLENMVKWTVSWEKTYGY